MEGGALMARPSMTRKRKAAIFAQHNGACHLCGGTISVGEAWDAEHVIPWEISRDDSDDNLRPAHKKCHASKTADDRRDIAKVQRIQAKHNGSWPKSKTPLRSRGFASSRPNYEQSAEGSE